MKKILDLEGTFGFFSGEIVGNILLLSFEENLMQQATNDTDQMNYVIADETLKETAQEFNTVIRSAEKLINTADLPESVQPIVNAFALVETQTEKIMIKKT